MPIALATLRSLREHSATRVAEPATLSIELFVHSRFVRCYLRARAESAMPRHRNLFLLLLVLNVPLLLLAVAQLNLGYREARGRATEQQLAVARAGAVASESFIVHNVATLRTLVTELGDADRTPADALQAQLAGYVASNPRWDGMSVVSADYRVMSGSQAASRGIDLADRAYLRRLFSSGQPAISDGLVPAVTRAPSVIVAVPFTLRSGAKAALLTSVKVDELAALLRQLIPDAPDRRISLVDQAGRQLIQPAGLEALAPAGADIFPPEANEGAPGVTETSGTEPRLIAYVPVGQTGWVVSVSDRPATAFAAANRFLLQGLLVVVVGTLTVTAAGFLLGRRLRSSYDLVVRAREEAEDAIRSRDEFLAVASHELRNPLAAILGRAQQMQRRNALGRLGEENLGHHLDELIAAGRHLTRLVEDLLNVSRLQAGKFDLRIERTNLHRLVKEATDEIGSSHHELDVAVPEDVWVSADPGRLRQVLANLLENAMKYSPRGSRIRVAANSSDDGATIRVTDQGIGLPPGSAERIFEPFARAVNAQQANIPGLGLGLYLSRQLVEAHGGTLTVSSPGEGQGAQFVIKLPANPEPVRSIANASPVNEQAFGISPPSP